jgi:hypothetical protein
LNRHKAETDEDSANQSNAIPAFPLLAGSLGPHSYASFPGKRRNGVRPGSASPVASSQAAGRIDPLKRAAKGLTYTSETEAKQDVLDDAGRRVYGTWLPEQATDPDAQETANDAPDPTRQLTRL